MQLIARFSTYGLVLGGGVAAFVVLRRRRAGGRSHQAPGGVLIDDVHAYDHITRWLLGPFFAGVAADVARLAPSGARVLDVGCGPGQLSLVLAGRHGLDVTGVDLDPEMVARARANAAAHRAPHDDGLVPTFHVGDVASLGEPDSSFDVVVSTMSLHHWSDPTAGMAEIGRVLRPGGRALIWDLKPGVMPFHHELPDPTAHADDAGLQTVSSTPWRWPWRFALTQRTELVADDG